MRLLSTLILSTLLLSGCSLFGSNEERDRVSNGEWNATIDGAPWDWQHIGSLAHLSTLNLNIGSTGRSAEKIPKESIGISMLPSEFQGTGKYAIHSRGLGTGTYRGGLFVEFDHDAIIAGYDAVEHQDTWLEIKHYEAPKGSGAHADSVGAIAGQLSMWVAVREEFRFQPNRQRPDTFLVEATFRLPVIDHRTSNQ